MKIHIALGMAVITATLSACSNNTTPPPADPMLEFTGQTLTWTACDPDLIENADTGFGLNKYPDIAKQVECTKLKAPVNYDSPSKGSLVVAFQRFKATAGKEGIEPLFLNPGGPGGDGLNLGSLFGTLAFIAPDIMPPALGNKMHQLLDRYDIVGFSPRGVTSSTPLICESPEFVSVDDDRTAKIVADACQRNAIAPYITTDYTVRDLDLFREVMHKQNAKNYNKANFIGVSYGTVLAAHYATKYPEKTGQFVLDGVVGMTKNSDGKLQSKAESQEDQFNKTLALQIAPFLTRNAKLFDFGMKPEDFLAQIQTDKNISARLKRIIFELTYGHDGVTYAGSIGLAYKEYKTIVADPIFQNKSILNWTKQQRREYEDRTEIVVAKYRKINPSLFSIMPFILGDLPYWALDNNYFGNFKFSNSGSVNIAIDCNEGISSNPTCKYWPVPANLQRPTLTDAVPGMLMTQSEFDVATPLSGALKTLDLYKNSKFIAVDNENTHGVLFHAAIDGLNNCTLSTALEFLVNKNLPTGRISVCQGAAYAPETEAFAAGEDLLAKYPAPSTSLKSNELNSQSAVNTNSSYEELRLQVSASIQKILEQANAAPFQQQLK
jgi:pimeloyl-ACP methyl ester carboxylesterase